MNFVAFVSHKVEVSGILCDDIFTAIRIWKITRYVALSWQTAVGISGDDKAEGDLLDKVYRIEYFETLDQ
jgi:hypothetical protein